MIESTEETWATNTLRDGQDPGAGTALWKPLSKLTLERYNLIFAQQHSRGYAADGQPEHDCGTVLENSANTLFKVALSGGDLLFTKWSVGNDPEIDDAVVVADANLSDTARPSMELVAGAETTVRIFYIDEDDDAIHYIESADSGDNFGAEQNVGALSDAKAIASVSTTQIHCVSYANGNTRFHVYIDDGGWAVTDSLLYWPHEVNFIDAITIGDRDLIVLYSSGPVYGMFREAGIYGIWYEHGRWSDLFEIDVVGEATDYSYRRYPMISTANSLYFLTLYAAEGDSAYSQALRALKISKDGQHWSQYQPLVTCTEGGPAKLFAIDAETDGTWPWSDGLKTYIVGYDKIYESDSTRLVGADNSDLQVDVSGRTVQWQQSRGQIAMATSLLANHDGGLDAHSIIDADNTLLAVREAGYYTGAGAEYAELSLEQVDFFKETDRLPRRHKQMVGRDLMSWMRDKKAKHREEWASQLIGYDNYDDDSITGRGGLSHTITKKGRWETRGNQLWLKSDNDEGITFASWGDRIMNGQVKAMIRIETASNDEYAGVVFRAHDEGNFLAAYYDEDTDKILLRHRYNDVWRPTLASSAALGWAIDTWYGVGVDFRYSYIRVLYSTDGLTWTQAFTHLIPRSAEGGPPEYGYVGLIGYGYSDRDTDEVPGYTPPLPPPEPGPEDMGPMGPAVAGHSIDGMYYTGGWGDEWEQRNSGLASTDILDLIWDPWWFTSEKQGTSDPEQVILWACGAGWVEKKVGAADWEDITPSTDPPNTWSDATPPTATTVTYKQIHGDIHNIDTFYVLAEWQEPDSGNTKWRGWIAKTITDGANWTWYALATVATTTTHTFIPGLEGWVSIEGQWEGDTGAACGLADNACVLAGPSPGQSVELDIIYPNKVTFDALTITVAAAHAAAGRNKWRLYTNANSADPADGGWVLAAQIDYIGQGCNTWVTGLAVAAPSYLRLKQIHVGFVDWARAHQFVFTNLGDAEEIRPLAMDLDTEDGTRLYVTLWRDDALYAQNHLANDISRTVMNNLAVATEAQVAAKTYFIVPRSPHSLTASGFGDYVWVFGRYNDGAEKHIGYSTDGAVSFANAGEGTWDANHRVGALDVLYDLTTVYALVNHATTPRLWESIDTGGAWSNINSLPIDVEFDALSRANWSADEEFLIGSNAAGAQMAAWLEKPYTGTWNDCTGSPGLPVAAGYISAIIWV